MASPWGHKRNRAASRQFTRLSTMLGAVALSTAANADTFNVGESIEGEYKLVATYAAAMRMEDQANALINGPIDNFEPQLLPSGQIVGFSHSGLPTTANFDDGNRNFNKHSLFNNRLTTYGELSFKRGNYGAAFSGSAFWDQVFHEKNDHDSPDTVNKRHGDVNEFTNDAEYFNGERMRLLDAYVYGDWALFDDSMFLNVRAGRHLAAWGESLFFAGVAQVQGPQDATKAFVPGAEIKDILLPINQVSFRLAATPELTLLGQYRLEHKPTEVFPVGDYFSPADAVGPGAKFIYGSQNPAYLSACPGLLPPPLDQLCALGGGAGGPLLNAPPYILVDRGKDILPDDDGQWGLGFTYQLTPTFNLGFYELRYHSANPTVKLTFGFPQIGSVAGIPLTTQLINQPAPVQYQIDYFENIKMHAMSFSTVLAGWNIGGEVSLREGVDTAVAANVAEVLTPIFSKADIGQALLSGLYVANPKFLMYDEWVTVAEVGFIRVYDVEKIDPIAPANVSGGMVPLGDGDTLFNDKESWAFQILMLPKARNIISGWDLTTPMSYGGIVKGNPPMNGAFAAYFGEGDYRASAGVTMQYLQNLEVAVAYNYFTGDPTKRISSDLGNSYVPQNPYMDRDNMTLSVKYQF